MDQPSTILLDKPTGVSSAEVLNQVKKSLRIRKMGHCGTLDPMATGLLICLTGSATRFASYIENMDKEYTGKFQFGLETNTDDITGEVLSRNSEVPEESQIQKLSEQFIGEIDQIPPQISAIRIEGKRAYALAREGKKVELKSRKVIVSEFGIKSTGKQGEYSFQIQCSKGTYIRSIARDLGKLAGCGACLSELRRTRIGPIAIDQTTTPDVLTEKDFLSWEILFPNARKIECSEKDLSYIQGGDLRCLASLSGSEGELALYFPQGEERARGLLKYEQQWKVAANLPVSN